MSRLALTLACGAYDRTQALLDGRVALEGIDLNPMVLPLEELFRRQARYAEFDVAEFSLATYAVLLGRGDDRFVGLPVFPSRAFRHGHILVNAHAGIESPADLAGRRVGCPTYTQTAAVWARGLLLHEYGVHQEQITWYLGGLDAPLVEERIAGAVPEGVPTVRLGPDQTLDALIDGGAIDALIAADWPRCFLTGSPNVRRLFPDYHEQEIEYYRRTGRFPIMHNVVVRRGVYERHRWVARTLQNGFVAAKLLGMRWLSASAALAAAAPFLIHTLEETRALMGGDYWPYGLAANRPELSALLADLHEQRLTPRLLDPEELFAPETHAELDPEQEAARPA
ncbi:MAG TPA: ABC transporter substrate-binding protein [Chloroflexota bacterium]